MPKYWRWIQIFTLQKAAAIGRERYTIVTTAHYKSKSEVAFSTRIEKSRLRLLVGLRSIFGVDKFNVPILRNIFNNALALVADTNFVDRQHR